MSGPSGPFERFRDHAVRQRRLVALLGQVRQYNAGQPRVQQFGHEACCRLIREMSMAGCDAATYRGWVGAGMQKYLVVVRFENQEVRLCKPREMPGLILFHRGS